MHCRSSVQMSSREGSSDFAFVCAPGSPDDTVNVLRRILKGQERKALKSLCSNGVATVNSTIAALKRLHPHRVGELKLPPKRVDQVCVMRKTLQTSSRSLPTVVWSRTAL